MVVTMVFFHLHCCQLFMSHWLGRLPFTLMGVTVWNQGCQFRMSISDIVDFRDLFRNWTQDLCVGRCNLEKGCYWYRTNSMHAGWDPTFKGHISPLWHTQIADKCKTLWNIHCIVTHTIGQCIKDSFSFALGCSVFMLSPPYILFKHNLTVTS